MLSYLYIVLCLSGDCTLYTYEKGPFAQQAECETVLADVARGYVENDPDEDFSGACLTLPNAPTEEDMPVIIRRILKGKVPGRHV